MPLPAGSAGLPVMLQASYRDLSKDGVDVEGENPATG